MAKTKSRVAERARGGHQADPERWHRLFIVGGIAAVVLLAVGIIGFGWYQTQVRPLDKVVLQVGDTKFNLAHLERRMRIERDADSSLVQPENVLQFPDRVLNQLELEAKLLEGAGELDITATEEDVAREIRERGNLANDVEASLYAAEFRRQVEDSGLKEGEYRQMLRAGILGQKVLDYFIYLAPQQEPQVRARWIVANDEDQGREALRRLKDGEDFGAVAQDISLDTTSAEKGGELDWMTRGAFPHDEIEDFLFEEAEPGELSAIISGPGLFYVVQLLERDDARPLNELQRQLVGNREMLDWLDGLDATLDIERDFTPEDTNRALSDVL